MLSYIREWLPRCQSSIDWNIPFQIEKFAYDAVLFLIESNW